ncbi:dihydrolipoyl dehydrogenase family protein [Candidatus Puniceispirillum marinum]|uniref:Pyridine nucleotide-disulfide oxidoreductase dimerization region n=1 Tax=Puniceispirillum marinum (strain IMCC1322) TaxID=488538 RepID=D5BTH0_PUNMI|nr:FAD-dependent oxidoreductase [Candidatus Puniceispirillum marinum]ADE39567.1 pyridine nucleotide-disulfide oxidoreductase dimerization region [Candidatus Puniceispirillum marinum IMCC1322]
MKTIKADIVIIGAGSGGLSLAAGAAQMGAHVVLFEGSAMGGDCLNSGCVPSKALLAAGKAAHNAHSKANFGVHVADTKIDFAAAKDYVDTVIGTIAPHDSVARFTSLGVTVISEFARFKTAHIVVSDTYEVTAKYIVIATGSTASVPPISGLDSVPYYTNETIFTDHDKPDHLVIIGGGPIGIEMAQAHCRLGVKVTIIEALAVMARDDQELVSILKNQLINEGVTIIEGAGVTKITQTTNSVAQNNENINVQLADGQVLHASHLLVAAGRRPALERLDLDAAGIKHNRAGIITDERLRANKKHIFAIGDVAGRQQFTHIAGYHAGIVIRNILFKLPAKIDDKAIPWVTYCDPELAHVGLTTDEAHARFGADRIRVLKAPLSGNDRAIAESRTEGMVKVITHKKGHILGASILAPNAGEMILAWAVAITAGQKIGTMASVIAPYPTYGDASKRAAGSFFTDKLFSPRMRRIVQFLMKF